jgi:hypothetical protein
MSPLETRKAALAGPPVGVGAECHRSKGPGSGTLGGHDFDRFRPERRRIGVTADPAAVTVPVVVTAGSRGGNRGRRCSGDRAIRGRPSAVGAATGSRGQVPRWSGFAGTAATWGRPGAGLRRPRGRDRRPGGTASRKTSPGARSGGVPVPPAAAVARIITLRDPASRSSARRQRPRRGDAQVPPSAEARIRTPPPRPPHARVRGPPAVTSGCQGGREAGRMLERMRRREGSMERHTHEHPQDCPIVSNR